MSIRRFLQCTALAAGAMMGASAMAQYSVSLQTSGSCNNTGTVTVNLVLSGTPGVSAAAGAQAFLNFDSGLTCTSITAGPSLQGIQLTYNNGAGTANVAVGTSAFGQTISQGAVLATLTFTTNASYCGQSGLVGFRTNNPPTRLTDNQAQAISVTTANLNAVTANDFTAPVVNGGNPLPALTFNADNGQCSTTVTVAAPGATDNCSLTGVRLEIAGPGFGGYSGVNFTAPGGTSSINLPVGTYTLRWTGEDSCGNATPVLQTLNVVDTQAPTITCGSTINASTDAGLCSATLMITPPSATDNCGAATVSFVSRSDMAALNAPFPKGTTTITWKATDANGLMSTCTQDVVVSDNQAPTVTAPSNVSVNADAGSCSALLSAAQIGSASVSDNCPGPYGAPIASLSSGGPEIVFPYAFPTGNTTIYWRASDASGNVGESTQIVTVSSQNTLVVSVQLAGVSSGPFTRCISFGLYSGGPCALAYSTSADVTFVNGSGTATLSVPCGSGPYVAITATDTKHTLRRTNSGASFGISGVNYVSSFTGSRSLQGGNVNNDEFIDILDFGGYIGQFGTIPGANTGCGYVGLNADFSGNGEVGLEDFTFIQTGFLNTREADPCGNFLQAGPRTDVSVDDLVNMGMRSAVKADRNLDGRVNAADVQMVLTTGISNCPADFNGDSNATVQDLFDFLSAWFARHPRADMNESGDVTVQDLFSFVSTWFQGC